MRNYWSCTPFADWLRGTMKPKAETSAGWSSWKSQAKISHPFRYWLAEEGLDLIQSTLMWPIDQLYNIKYYINNRWVTRTHTLTASPKSIPRGQWCDYGNRILPCLFDELVNFVEIEQATMNIVFDKEAREQFKAPWWSHGWFKWRVWRSPESGLAYLKWASTLTDEEWLDDADKHLAKPTGQALAAKEILELYHWWKNVYPNRPEPHDASGWTDWCDRRRAKVAQDDELSFLDSSNETESERKESYRILDKCREIEAAYEAEDTEMLIRLICIRDHLWT